MTNTINKPPWEPPTPTIPVDEHRSAIGYIVGALVLVGLIAFFLGVHSRQEEERFVSQSPPAVLDEIWAGTGFCYSTCERMLSPSIWAERAGPFDPIEVRNIASFMLEDPANVRALCDEFWIVSHETLRVDVSDHVDPNAWIAASYAVCDS